MHELSHCPLCRWESDPDQQIVKRHDLVLFLQNAAKQGVLAGSGVIAPKRHAPTVFDLSDDEISATFVLLREVKAWMDATYQPDGYNVGWNCGAVGGQEIMHAHLHVIPRFKDEPYAGRGIRSWLKTEPNRRPSSR
jgi:diadenosine tetraphosphate (Ap4A) HIT family hydrolase